MRTYVILGASVTMLLAILGTITVVSGSLSLSAIFANAALIAALLTVLLATRYLARLFRTEHRKFRTALVELEDKLEISAAADMDQHRLTKEQTERLAETLSLELGDTFKQLERLYASVRNGFGSTARHITKTMRDSTRQTEAFLQLHSQFPQTKLPMPSTGGFAIDAQALSHLITLVNERRPQNILELGSGTSTICLVISAVVMVERLYLLIISRNI